MKINIHKKIARYFGYEFTRISQLKYKSVEQHLLSLFEMTGINCVMDVGANVGQFGTAIRKAGYTGQILSFEPVTSCYKQLEKMTDENWTAFNYALGSHAERKEINITNKSVFSSILKPNKYSEIQFDNSALVNCTEEIEIKKLDEVFSEFPFKNTNPVVFLKLDTQGFDLEVLKGVEKNMNAIQGLMTEISCVPIYENMPTHIDSLGYIKNLGFEITHIFPLGHDKKDMRLLEFDAIFKKTG